MISILVVRDVHPSPFPLEKADCGDLLNLGISWVPEAGWMESKLVLESVHGRPIVHVTFCSSGATWIKENSAYAFVELLKAGFR